VPLRGTFESFSVPLKASHWSANDSNSHYKNWFFERQPTAAFQKTNFGYCSAYGAAIPKIGFKMRIAELTRDRF